MRGESGSATAVTLGQDGQMWRRKVKGAVAETSPDDPQIDGTPLADAAAILWDEARRQIASQVSEVDILRTRSVAILSVASIVAGLFGGRIVGIHPHPVYVTIAVTVALICFAVSVIAIIVVLTPKKNKWEFDQNLSSYFVDLDSGDLAPLDVTARLAEHSELSRVKNKLVLDKLYSWFAFACVLVGLQVVAWGVAIF